MAWYISLTLRWADLDGALEPFFQYCEQAEIPSDHIRIHRDSWHSTLYAIASIERVFSPHKSMPDCARAVLEQFRLYRLPELLAGLPAFWLSPTHLKHFANSTTIQFEAEREKLTRLRFEVSNAISGITLPFDTDDVHYPLKDDHKNVGFLLWGSIARNPAPSARNDLQQEIEIPDYQPGRFRAANAILTISDEALTNHLVAGDCDYIPLV